MSPPGPERAGGPRRHRSRVAHNALLNFLGLAVPLALAFFVMPIAARYLGTARFGLLGLAWAVTEYLTLFDLGLGRALVKFVADALHRDASRLGEIVSLGVIAQIIAGILGGAAFFFAAPILVHQVFKVSPETTSEAVAVFRIVGLSVPVVLLTSAQRAVLEGAQRFDLSAAIKMSSSMVSLAIPAIGAVYGASLGSIMLGVLLSRLIICAVYATAIRRALPTLRLTISRDWELVRQLFSFGGWVLVSNTISPLLVYFDRFVLGSIGGLVAVGFYTAPYEGVTRLLVIPVSLVSTILPALTSLEARSDAENFARLAGSSERLLAVVMAVPLSVIVVFAPDLLRVWLGGQYAVESASALRVLALGVFANTLAQPLFVALYARSRPDLPAKFHLIELGLHLPTTIVLIRTFGITGAAVAWTARVILDLCLLFWAAARTSRSSAKDLAGGRAVSGAVVIALLLVGLVVSKLLASISIAVTAAVALGSVAAFIAASWFWVFRDAERSAIRGMLRSCYPPFDRMTAA